MKTTKSLTKSSAILKTLSTLGLIALIAGAASIPDSRADDTMETKVKNTAEDAKTNSKKKVRKGKKAVRDATGNGDVVKDAKDSINNAGDDIKGSANKLNNKAKE